MEDYKEKYNKLVEAVKALQEANPSDEGIRNWVNDNVPELKESEDEKIMKELKRAIAVALDYSYFDKETADNCIAWLEKQGKQHSAIRWYDVSLIPQEMEELLVEWDSEDATWHEIAFYHADTKTFWNGTRQVENVTRWCYIIDLLEKQGEQKSTWSEGDETLLYEIVDYFNMDNALRHTENEIISWLNSLKQRLRV